MAGKPKSEIKKWAETTTMHGVNNIFESSNFVKRIIYRIFNFKIPKN